MFSRCRGYSVSKLLLEFRPGVWSWVARCATNARKKTEAAGGAEPQASTERVSIFSVAVLAFVEA